MGPPLYDSFIQHSFSEGLAMPRQVLGLGHRGDVTSPGPKLLLIRGWRQDLWTYLQVSSKGRGDRPTIPGLA